MTDINTIYYFDDFVLNPARREIKRDDTSVEIEPRAFDVLLYLVVNHDRAVDKDELQDAVWPGLIVTETALTRAVMKARKAVGDDASEQKVIKTLHGHGYRFVAKLSSQDGARQVENTVATSDAPSGPVQDKKAQLNLHAVALIGIAAIIILGLSLVFLRPAKNLADETRIAVLPVQDN